MSLQPHFSSKPDSSASNFFPPYVNVSTSINLSLNYLVNLQNQALQHILEQNRTIAELIQRINANSANHPEFGSKERPKVPETFDTKPEVDKPGFRLVLGQDLQTPILKERGFTLTGTVRDRFNALAPQATGVKLQVFLHAQDSPNSPLQTNIAGNVDSGKKAIRGTVTTEVQDDGSFTFPNIVVNEVSSHYIDDAFMLIVRDEANEFKPLVIKRLSVRARKAKALESCSAG